MRKILCCLIVLIMTLGGISVSAETEVTYESIYSSENQSIQLPLIYNDGTPPEFNEINGEKYIWISHNAQTCHAIKYSEILYNTLKQPFSDKELFISDCIFTGEYYIVRDAYSDNSWVKAKPYMTSSVDFYDTEMNLLQTYSFDGYVEAIEFCDDYCYCCVITENGTKIMKSNDCENWYDVTDEECILPIRINDVVFKEAVYGIRDTKVSIDKKTYFNIANEKFAYNYYTGRFGKYTYFVNDNSIYFSNDNIYYIEVPLDIDLKESDISYIYEYGDYIVVDTSRLRIKILKQEVYDALEATSQAPYLVYNGSILAFETPPVIENGTTLIPIRFLFEQMGAEVDWDSDTQTASISKDGTVITFTIDNTTAMVNGEPAEMTLPAQLINDKTMVPVRFLSEELGYTVDWDGENRIITIE